MTIYDYSVHNEHGECPCAQCEEYRASLKDYNQQVLEDLQRVAKGISERVDWAR